MIRLTYFFSIRQGDWNDVAPSAFSQLFRLVADSTTCSSRWTQHIAEQSLCCALCTCSTNYCKSKISIKKKKNKQTSWRSENVAAHASFLWKLFSAMGQTVQTTHKLCINKRRERRKRKTCETTEKIWQKINNSICNSFVVLGKYLDDVCNATRSTLFQTSNIKKILFLLFQLHRPVAGLVHTPVLNSIESLTHLHA